MRCPAAVACLAVLLGLGGCERDVRWFAPDDYPDHLSGWGLTQVEDGTLVLHDGILPYDLATPLFSDYAQKMRAIYLPPGTRMTYRSSAAFEFPPGSIIVKTFYFPRASGRLLATDERSAPGLRLDMKANRALETRLLVRQADGWDALPYIWDGQDARLAITGAILDIELTGAAEGPVSYLVPSRNDCAGCHATDHTSGNIQPIGIKARHLNKTGAAGIDRLTNWQARDRLTALPDPSERPANADWRDTGHTLEERARAYLDANCGHCHSATGPADTSGLFLDIGNHTPRQLGICKPPVAAGRGSGNRLFGIVPGHPDESILPFRMISDDPGNRMPEVGRAVMHEAGVRLIDGWIRSMTGSCSGGQSGAGQSTRVTSDRAAAPAATDDA